MKPARIQAEVSGNAELRKGVEGRKVKAMGPVVHLAGILCIALAAACAGAGEPQPAVAGHAGSAADAQFPSRPASHGIATQEPPETVPSSAFAIEQMLRNGDPAVAGQAPERPLDVATLKLRLRETTSIGVFAKLALRSEMDDLMQLLRWHHRGSDKISVADLRLLYDQLVSKVLSLIWDGDPPLARAIARSRESIWGVLADPEQFESAS